MAKLLVPEGAVEACARVEAPAGDARRIRLTGRFHDGDGGVPTVDDPTRTA